MTSLTSISASSVSSLSPFLVFIRRRRTVALIVVGIQKGQALFGVYLLRSLYHDFTELHLVSFKMASLRAFQTEIDQIHAKTAAEQTRIAAATVDKKAKAKDVPDAPKADPTTTETVQEDDEDLAAVQVCTLDWMSFSNLLLIVLADITPRGRIESSKSHGFGCLDCDS